MIDLKEIGSEFWIEDDVNVHQIGDSYKLISSSLGFNGDCKLLLSGRTSIDFICQDIEQTRSLRTVLMPAYCCESMILPFINRGIKVDFYDVKFRNNNLIFSEVNEVPDVLYLSSYFGFPSFIDIAFLKKTKSKGTIILYDRTHSLFPTKKDVELMTIVDYSFSSLRKWFNIPSGAIVCKSRGIFSEYPLSDCHYVKYKMKGMQEKYKFLCGCGDVTKKDYFALFEEFDSRLHTDYRNYRIDTFSKLMFDNLDLNIIKDKRKDNAAILYDILTKEECITFMFPYDTNVVPLFVPIMIKPSYRDDLKKYLISKNIYCPIHWPKYSAFNNDMTVNEIYMSELSLLCDQRYSKEQMCLMAEVLKEYINNK